MASIAERKEALLSTIEDFRSTMDRSFVLLDQSIRTEYSESGIALLEMIIGELKSLNDQNKQLINLLENCN